MGVKMTSDDMLKYEESHEAELLESFKKKHIHGVYIADLWALHVTDEYMDYVASASDYKAETMKK